MNTKEQITKIIEDALEISPKEIIDELDVSERTVYKTLAKLIEENKIEKIGTTPKVFYRLKNESKNNFDYYKFSKNEEKILGEEYLYISPLGDYHEGVNGFVTWCVERNFNPESKIKEYIKTRKEIYKKKNSGFIDASKKVEESFGYSKLFKLYYIDFYSIPKFGKTKLGQLLLYAKQSQDKNRIKLISDEVRTKIEKLIKIKNIDAVGFVPPTVKREVQFIKELEKNLNLNVPVLKISKARTEIMVPQKTLSKLKDRIANAKNTIIVEDDRPFKNVLIIDDAVGSGATLNETSIKLMKRMVAKKVYGVAITGSFKGFDVISEV